MKLVMVIVKEILFLIFVGFGNALNLYLVFKIQSIVNAKEIDDEKDAFKEEYEARMKFPKK